MFGVCGGGEEEGFYEGGPESYINLHILNGVLLACLTNLLSRVEALSSELLPHLLTLQLFWPRADLAALTTGPEAALPAMFVRVSRVRVAILLRMNCDRRVKLLNK
jgi:hypothetical protein